MDIRFLNAAHYKNMVISGAQNVIATQEHLNKINVFPVPDGDTGSNMAAAFESIALAAMESDTTHLNVLAREVADGALNGSRGNSGSILAQFFQGLYQGFGTEDEVSLEQFAKSAVIGAAAAREAISNPIEGTIITVMHDWAAWLEKHWSDYQLFNDLMRDGLKAANDSLAHTPDQLKVLAKNHVVDAGAQGFVNFVEGATNFILTGKVPELELEDDTDHHHGFNEATVIEHSDYPHDVHLSAHSSHDCDLTHQFCTECIIGGEGLDLNQVKQKLGRWGNSMVVIGGSTKIKVHIHTNAPDKVFKDANTFGELLETKADDMWAQYRTNLGWQINKSIAIVTDSSCDLPQDFFVKYGIINIPLQIIINNKVYLDRVNLSKQGFLDKLTNIKNTISTSQPAITDIQSAFNKAYTQSATTMGIFLSSKLSGSFETIKGVAEKMDSENIHLFDSRTASGGLGLIVSAAARAIAANQPFSNIKKATMDAIANTTTFVSFATIKYVVKGGRVKKSVGWLATILRLLPVTKLDASGEAQKVGFTFGKAANRKKVIKEACRYAKQFRQHHCIVTHSGAEKIANKAARKIEKALPDVIVDVVETTPVLATHTGPGTLAVSILGEN